MRTVLGAFLVLVGIVLLVLPGPGLLLIAVGLGLMDLPISHRLRSWAHLQVEKYRSKREQKPNADDEAPASRPKPKRLPE